MELTEDEIEVLRAIAGLDDPTVETARDRVIGGFVVGDDITAINLTFRRSLQSLCTKGAVTLENLPDCERLGAIPPVTRLSLTDAGWVWINAHC